MKIQLVEYANRLTTSYVYLERGKTYNFEREIWEKISLWIIQNYSLW